ncbi:malonate decarboxylase acyl carrier protein [Sphingomonas sp. PAMC26645]|uniref:malonate decarboxylase acyl carrier protein n=1 Tax=Sphingomonas sp. PAMC26645 TaxID=2565555 RepID=UPI00109E1455|nr:malonate decarboxylase acyl carrier protein [Sphingomonas sp. PAMC26645]QCB43317.1 malonate decarboxylase acyl carrier protein [Sphingomonas sp. PAMC26645]
MENLTYNLDAPVAAGGTKTQAIIGVVASGNLEVLLERTLPEDKCSVEIATSAHGFGDVWQAVVSDFVALRAAGGLRISINDGGARPDTVALRLAQGVRLIESAA